jgi:hypothetical protein
MHLKGSKDADTQEGNTRKITCAKQNVYVDRCHDSIQLMELIYSIDENVLLVPCHAWTPWFALYGSNSGFDSINDCFGEYANKIYAVETGLSSDPYMNWQIKELENRSLLSWLRFQWTDGSLKQLLAWICWLFLGTVFYAYDDFDDKKTANKLFGQPIRLNFYSNNIHPIANLKLNQYKVLPSNDRLMTDGKPYLSFQKDINNNSSSQHSNTIELKNNESIPFTINFTNAKNIDIKKTPLNIINKYLFNL